MTRTGSLVIGGSGVARLTLPQHRGDRRGLLVDVSERSDLVAVVLAPMTDMIAEYLTGAGETASRARQRRTTRR